ncbi:MFS transporter [Methanobacterium paludis]|uniref:Drug resistance transporter, EmrB/QacA subfamily n=1 Tax=Methanobacterium paludis (strain DSM 25820 / JCM 18151 / SWAN1) TaxID=868131 RepID=F6D6G7_METPW|nr:MFS transporter [Methanobacterium paludis]AEG19400.1 drug resistance transporter, EmrB/QacA subfamily [Methanobacterium paludis]
MKDPYRKSWQILFAIALGSTMVPINASLVNVSLPSITEFFGTSLVTSEWVLTSYLITLLGFVLFFGRLGDFLGHERLYLTGLVGFILTSLLCNLAPSIQLLIIFRALQGFTAAMMLSVSMGIIKKSFPTYTLGKALGIYAVAVAAGLALGPAIGGILDAAFGWRAIFLVNVPTGILSFLLCYRILKIGETKKVKWDIPGTLLEFACLFAVVYILNYITINSLNIETILMIVFAVVTFLLFIRRENRVEDPMLNLSLFKNPSFSAYNLSLHFNYICMYMIIFIMPFYLQKVLHLTPNTTGLVLTASPIIMMALAPLSGALSDRFGSRSLSFLGAMICVVAFYSMTQLTIFSTATDVFLRLALLGVGTAIFQSPTNKAIMAKIPMGQAGVASGIIVTMRNLGMVFAVCYAGILINFTVSPAVLQMHQLFNLDAYNFTTGMHLVVTFAAILSAGMAVLSIMGMGTEKIKKEVSEIYDEVKP